MHRQPARGAPRVELPCSTRDGRLAPRYRSRRSKIGRGNVALTPPPGAFSPESLEPALAVLDRRQDDPRMARAVLCPRHRGRSARRSQRPLAPKRAVRRQAEDVDQAACVGGTYPSRWSAPVLRGEHTAWQLSETNTPRIRGADVPGHHTGWQVFDIEEQCMSGDSSNHRQGTALLSDSGTAAREHCQQQGTCAYQPLTATCFAPRLDRSSPPRHATTRKRRRSSRISRDSRQFREILVNFATFVPKSATYQPAAGKFCLNLGRIWPFSRRLSSPWRRLWPRLERLSRISRRCRRGDDILVAVTPSSSRRRHSRNDLLMRCEIRHSRPYM